MTINVHTPLEDMKEFLSKFSVKNWLPALIILAGVLIFVLLKIAQPAPKPVMAKKRIWQVKTIPAHYQPLSPELVLYGQVEAPDLIKAAAPGKGRVEAINVREGNHIRKGQPLLSLDPRDFRPRLMQAEARVAELQALIDSERLRYQSDRKALRHEEKLLSLEQSAVARAERLNQKKMGSTAALELAQEELERQQLSFTNREHSLKDHEARLQQLEARLRFAQAELEIAQLDLERSQIIAPFNGFIESVHVATGDHVMENQLLLSFYPDSQLEVRAKIPAPFRNEVLSIMNEHQQVTAQTRIAGQTIDLTLARLSGSADASGIDALFTLPGRQDLIRLGSMLSLSLQRPVTEQVIAVPFSALYDNDKIYLLNEGKLSGVRVQRLGEYSDQHGRYSQLITSPDIKPGDRIVITNLPNAVTGLPVEENRSSPSTN